jgi:hypothetical protein
VAVVLDRYGHLFEGHEAAVLSRLDAFAECVSVPPGDATNQECEVPVPVRRSGSGWSATVGVGF